MRTKLDQLFSKIYRDPLYLDSLLRTLEINKIQKKYQEEGQPPIFEKEYDDLGLVKKFSMHPSYEGRVPMPRQEFTEEEWRAILGIIEQDEGIGSKLVTMMGIGLLEAKLLDSLQGKGMSKGPLILIEIDKHGFPEGCRINPRYDIKIDPAMPDIHLN